MTAPDPAAPRIAGSALPTELAGRYRESRASLASGDASAGDLAEARAFVAWADRLPQLAQEISASWGLQLAQPYSPGGSCSWVAPGRDADGESVVLKLAWAHDEARDEAAGLVAWQGHGAVGVRATAQHEDTTALLLDRVDPGRQLFTSLPAKQQDVVVAGLLRRLWEAPAADPGSIRPLDEMCSWWADHAAERLARDPRGLPGTTIERGLALFRTLPRSAPRTALLATDLHPQNVLSTREDPGTDLAHWRVIDPKPYLGDPHYDLLQHMLNFPERLRADPAGFATSMADLAGLDPERTVAWLFARCVQEAGVMDGAAEVAQRLARTQQPAKANNRSDLHET